MSGWAYSKGGAHGFYVCINFDKCGAAPDAGAAPDDETDYDDAAFNDDGPTRPPQKYHGRGNNWPVTVKIYGGLDYSPPPCLASPQGGAGAATENDTDRLTAHSHSPLPPHDVRPKLCSIGVTCIPYRP